MEAQLQFLTNISQSGPMSPADMLSKLQPTSIQISAIQELRENKRQSDYFNHLSAISESIPALGWVTINQDPSHYVKEMNDAGQFYSNRVLKEWKEINKVHVDWVKAWVETLTDLQNYVQNYYSTGLVCYEINFEKVIPEMQTYKCATLRFGSVSVKETYHSPDDKIVNTVTSLEKSPKFSKDGKKWIVEYQTGVPDLMIDNVDLSDIVYMFKCQSTNLVIKGKLNSVILDSCCNSSIVFDSISTGIEFINCQSVHMQLSPKEYLDYPLPPKFKVMKIVMSKQ
uniref:(California timema) hypothetical protein n=1 Tax=Timema californicum TaxID=61474 RepID=A0A7R9J6H4_TIMCA|nr:unnamed protein product [Timema californicum]